MRWTVSCTEPSSSHVSYHQRTRAPHIPSSVFTRPADVGPVHFDAVRFLLSHRHLEKFAVEAWNVRHLFGRLGLVVLFRLGLLRSVRHTRGARAGHRQRGRRARRRDRCQLARVHARDAHRGAGARMSTGGDPLRLRSPPASFLALGPTLTSS